MLIVRSLGIALRLKIIVYALSLCYNAERLAVSIHVPINLVSAYEITHEKVKPIHARIRLRLKRESQHVRSG